MLKRLILTLALLAPMPAEAALCPSFPFTLLNNQTADANQVMADFNVLMTCLNQNVATNGANSNITGLFGLTTPLSVGQGGTGVGTLTANSLLVGNGASALTFLAPGASGTVVGSTGTAWAATNGVTFSGAPTAVGAEALWTGSVWSVSQQKPAIHCFATGSQTPGNGSVGKVAINSCTLDTTSSFNTSTNRYTPPAGVYLVSGSIYATNVSAAAELLCGFGKNGLGFASSTGFSSSGTVEAIGAGNLGCHATAIISVNGTDTIELDGELSNSTTGTWAANDSFFDAVKVSN